MKKVWTGKYRFIKHLGKGAGGKVYLVENLHLHRKEALKVCEDAGQNRPLLQEEALVLMKLAHPMLPRVYDLFLEEGMLCMVMEYIEGMTLEEYLKKFGRIEEDLAIRWAVSLTEVLSYLHEQKPEIIYRDLKPGNIMVLPDKSIRLIDLGAAYLPAYGQQPEMPLMGTPGYGAPEQWQGRGACKESDVYALGMVLHEMVTGIHPVSACQEPRPVREFDRSLSHKIEAVIIRCIKKQTEERYHSMEHLGRELKSCKKEQRNRKRKEQLQNSVGMLLLGIAMLRTLVPFLWGVREKEFPFPYMKVPLILLGISLGYRMLIMRKRKTERIRMEKSVFLTAKHFPGLYAGILLLLSVFYLESGTGNLSQMQVMAADKNQELWVEMRDEKGRKCLVREGTAFSLSGKMWFELAEEDLPKGLSRLQLIAVGEDEQVYESRLFLVENN